MSYWYKQNKTIRCRSKSWELNKYNWAPEGLGDSLIFSAYAYLVTRDPELLENIIECLEQGKRWNDESNPPPFAWGYRSQYSMTRDVYIVCLSVLYLTDNLWIIERIRIPWWLWRPDFYFWFKSMLAYEKGEIEKDLRYMLKYKRWALINLLLFGWQMPMYAKLLAAWMARTAGGDKVFKQLLKNIPKWNLLIRTICGDKPDLKQVREYVPVEGFRWQGDRWRKDKKPIPFEEKYHIDKDLLIYAWENF